jgi:sulfate adenylyltransferase large subunit
MAAVAHTAPRDEFREFLRRSLTKELLRFTTAGSVDDGKSTLIGRLLHDSGAAYEDQLASVKKSRINHSSGPIDFSLLSDGLRAEREQGITIDVGYLYFSTPRRKFIIADAPGHEQYTRNMATGASTADLAVILMDATKGVLPQTRRHAYIASLLGISSFAAAINKMDLLDYREETFRKLEAEFASLARQLGVSRVQCIPVSALAGDNVAEYSENTPWYRGPTLLEHLETVPIERTAGARPVRFPVQYVIRPDASFRGFAGQIAGGVVRPGDTVRALPSGQITRVESITTYGGRLSEAFSPMSVTLTLEDEIDVSRGDMLVSPQTPPYVSRRFAASMVWMDAQPLNLAASYLLKHGARQVRCQVTSIRHRVNIQDLEPEATERLQMNDIASVEIETSSPLFFDCYQQNRATGSFILIDSLSNSTLGAGMIRENLQEKEGVRIRETEANPRLPVTSLERRQRHGHDAAIILASARAGLAGRIERALFEDGFEVILIGEAEPFLASPRTAWAALHAAGFVVIYQRSKLREEEKLELKAAAGHRFFDLAELDASVSDPEAIARVRAFAESLRVPGVDLHGSKGA